MDWKRAFFFLILLLFVGFRHISFSNNETRFDELNSVLSDLHQIDLVLEDTIKRLGDFEMAAPPDQDYLIIMASDNLELIKLTCFYNAQLLSHLMSGAIEKSNLSAYADGVTNNLEYEKVRIQNNLDRLDSIYPVLKDRAVLDTIDTAKTTVQSIIRLFDKSIDILEANR